MQFLHHKSATFGMSDDIQLEGIIGRCGDREVFMGFARAQTLAKLSFPDVLDEATGSGYQRRFSPEHSLEFKRYIHTERATSIPLTFNLRPLASRYWRLVRTGSPSVRHATLTISSSNGPVMAQVDGQHRLGFLQDSPIEFAFMAFLGVSVEDEVEIFRTINGKAKGLSSSLLDYTEARSIGTDLPIVKPELYIALRLHEDPRSPWYQRLDLGGQKTIGMKRIASLRTMQVAIKRMARTARWPVNSPPSTMLAVAIDFWRAVAFVLPTQWQNPRKHVLAKGVGVYALMSLAGQLVVEARASERCPDFDFFVSTLSDFVDDIDWSNDGTLQGYGGVAGADKALEMMIQVRTKLFRRLSAHV